VGPATEQQQQHQQHQLAKHTGQAVQMAAAMAKMVLSSGWKDGAAARQESAAAYGSRARCGASVEALVSTSQVISAVAQLPASVLELATSSNILVVQ
jgi:hypothetical protein